MRKTFHTVKHHLFVFGAILGLLAVGASLGSQPVGSAAKVEANDVDPRLAGHPEALFQITDDGIAAPGALTAGRYLVVQENLTVEEAHFFITRLPDDVSDEQIDADLAVDRVDAADQTPEWFYRSTFTGNPDRSAPNGGRQYGLVDFTPGRYLVMDPLAPWKFDRFSVSPSSEFPVPIVGSISGLPPVAAVDRLSHEISAGQSDPIADVVANMTEMTFVMPATVSAGRQVWEVHNTGAIYHEIAIQPVPVGATNVQVMTAFDALFNGELASGELGLEWADWQYHLINGVGVSSPGQTVWAQFDLAPGTYAAVCFAPTDGVPHLMMGMIQVFTVV